MSNSHILIVEDETIVAMDIEDELKTLGYTVAATVISGEEAIHQAEETRPDLVLMDIRLKGEMDGIEAAEEIRARFNIPVVYLTAYADDDTLERAKITEPFGYIIKPFQERDLHTTIEMALYKHRTERKLQAYATELEQQNRELEIFAHTVANNLNSLAKMMANQADILQSRLRLPDEYQQSLDTIARSGRKMNHVIQELLLLAKVRQTEVGLTRLNMARIVAQAQQRLAEMVEEHQAEIILPGHWPEVLGYGPWVEEVWVNYLSHGIQYGGQPPRVRVGATIQSNRQVRFWLRANGPGVSPAEEKGNFTPSDLSHQIHEWRLRLSIARHIVEKLGGQVSVESEGVPGQGTVFSFTLLSPLSK